MTSGVGAPSTLTSNEISDLKARFGLFLMGK